MPALGKFGWSSRKPLVITRQSRYVRSTTSPSTVGWCSHSRSRTGVVVVLGEQVDGVGGQVGAVGGAAP